MYLKLIRVRNKDVSILEIGNQWKTGLVYGPPSAADSSCRFEVAS